MKQTFIILFSFLLTLGSFKPLNPHKYKVKTVVIDAGHGGKDSGCLGKKLKEKNISLAVAIKLGRLIKSNDPSVRVLYTRSSDKFIDLHHRASLANKNNADLFISIHCNSGPNDACGSETYSMGLHVTDENLKVAQRENAVILKEDNYVEKYDGFNPNSSEAYILFSLFQNAFLEQSLKLAGNIENELATREGRKSRGVKQAGFLVLYKTSMPSVLVELGFLTNPRDENFLSISANQDSVAGDLFTAIMNYKGELEATN
ncbi:MAG: N-acetylmuramoyl-L-alanine amidase [Bacteroidetes bacterium RIFCSPLOWO2_12_FULL_37_12]|nr:MAG: N-acetylmuramoyl-L-alanine amidase [Bacteroidetes bacterium RIFCSPLOWO2_12_FULL_37_12]